MKRRRRSGIRSEDRGLDMEEEEEEEEEEAGGVDGAALYCTSSDRQTDRQTDGWSGKAAYLA